MSESAEVSADSGVSVRRFASAVRAAVVTGPWRPAAIVLTGWAAVVVAASDGVLDVAAHVAPALAALVAATTAFIRADATHDARRTLLLFGAAGVVWACSALLAAGGAAWPSWSTAGAAEGIEVGAHLLLIVTFLSLEVPGPRIRHVRALLDIAMILVATAMVAVGLRLVWVNDPTRDHEMGHIVLHSVLALLTFGLVADTLGRLEARWRHGGTWAAGAAGLLVVAEVLAAMSELTSIPGSDQLVGTLWVVAWLSFAIGVTAPEHVRVPRMRTGDAGWTGVVSVAIAIGFLIWIEVSRGTLSDDPALEALGLIAMIAVLTRAVAFQIESAALHSDLRRQERRASERAERYEEALEAAGAGFWEFDIAGDEVSTTRGIDRLLERDGRGDVSFDEFVQSVSPAARPQVIDHVRMISDQVGEAPVGAAPPQAAAEAFVAEQMDRATGVVVETRGRVQRDASGRITVVSGVTLDVTERHRAEDLLRRQAERSARLVDFGRRSLAAATLDAVVWDALDVIADDIDLVSGRILEHDPVGQGLSVVASVGGGRRASTGDNTANRAAVTARTTVVAAGREASGDSGEAVGAGIPINAESGVWGVIDVEAGPSSGLGEVDIRFVESVATLVASAVNRERAQAELRYRSLHDRITGLPNRELVIDRVGQLVASAGSRGDGVVVLHIGLDRFGQINDSLGHQAGDHALAEVGRRIAALCPTGGSAARSGGDEFVLAFPAGAVSTTDTFTDVVQREIARPIWIGGTELFVTASIGEARSGHGTTPEVLLTNAATATRAASASGGACRRLYSPGDRARSVDRVRIEADLRHALRRGEIVPWYQPVIRIADRRVVAAEALARWERPGGSMVLPGEFIPVAEQSGLIGELGRAILGRAMDDARRWVGPNGERPHCSVNVASPQLVDGSIVEVVAEELERSGLDPDRLVLEVVEGEIVDANYDRALATVGALKRFDGVCVAVDDFGTGHSSLARLHSFPVDVIKIDRRFVAAITATEADRALVKAIIDMAAALSLDVVAEGVETEEQFEILRDLGCDYAQGWLFAPAMPACELLALPLDEFVIDDQACESALPSPCEG